MSTVEDLRSNLTTLNEWRVAHKLGMLTLIQSMSPPGLILMESVEGGALKPIHAGQFNRKEAIIWIDGHATALLALEK